MIYSYISSPCSELIDVREIAHGLIIRTIRYVFLHELYAEIPCYRKQTGCVNAYSKGWCLLAGKGVGTFFNRNCSTVHRYVSI